MESDHFRGQLNDPELIELYDYWLACRGDRRMPSRRDLDPLRMPKQLPSLMLIDVFRDPLRFRYRLVGTRVVAASAEDRTGKFFDNVVFFKTNPVVMEQYRKVVDEGLPLFSLEPFLNYINNTAYQVDRLMLPLAGDGATVDMILVHFLFRTGPYATR